MDELVSVAIKLVVDFGGAGGLHFGVRCVDHAFVCHFRCPLRTGSSSGPKRLKPHFSLPCAARLKRRPFKAKSTPDLCWSQTATGIRVKTCWRNSATEGTLP